MSYLDIDKQIAEMTNDLKQKMIAENIIDKKGNALNVEEFNRLLDQLINKCWDMLKTLESERRYDANSNNIIFTRIENFKTMKEHQAFTLYVEPEYRESKYEEEDIKDPPKKGKRVWFNGIRKLFAKRNNIQPDMSPEREM